MKPQSSKSLSLKKRFGRGVAAAMLVTSLFGALSFAQERDGTSTNGGGGDPTARAKYREMALAAEVNLSVTDPAFVGSRDRVAKDIDLWCSRVINFLDRYLKQAHILATQDQYTAAVDKLREAMVVSVMDVTLDPRLASPVTLRLLRRGLEISAALDTEIERPNAMSDKYALLSKFVELVINVSEDLDRAMITFVYGGISACDGPCMNLRRSQYEQKYLNAAARQLKLAVELFTDIGVRNETDPVFVFRGESDPNRFGRIYVLATALLAQGVVNDIGDPNLSLDSFANSCVIQDLRTLISKLPEPSSDYLNFSHEVDSVSKEIKRLARRIARGDCPAERKELNRDPVVLDGKVEAKLRAKKRARTCPPHWACSFGKRTNIHSNLEEIVIFSDNF